MVETVNIPLLLTGAMRRRRSDTTAGRRKSPLKDKGVDEGSEVHLQSRSPTVRTIFGESDSVGNPASEKIR